MTNVKRLFVVLMVLVMALSLAACGGKDDSGPSTVWVPTYHTIEKSDFEFDYINNSVYDAENEKIYILTYGRLGTEVTYDEEGNKIEYEKYGNMVLTCNADGTGMKLFSDYEGQEIPEGYHGGSSIYNMELGANGDLWMLENIYMYPARDDYDWSENVDTYNLVQFDKNGELVKRIELASLAENADYFYVNDFVVDDDNNVYIVHDTFVYVVDGASGEMMFKLEQQDGWINSVFKLADGSIAVSGYGNSGGGQIKTIDVAKKAWGTTSELGKDLYNAFDGIRGYDLCFYDSNGVFGYKLADGTSELIFNWLDADINYGGVTPFTIDDDTFMLITSNYNSNGTYTTELITVDEVDASTVTPKTELILAAYYLDYQLRNEIIQFNKTNSEYRIKVVDYSIYDNYTSDNEADWNAGLTRLNTELISGNIPDILATSSLPLDVYGSRGILEDLYPWIDKTMGRDAIVEGAFDAVDTEDGKLYVVFPYFELMTLVGNADMLANYKPWTIDSMIELAEDHPESDLFSYYYTRDTFINTMLIYCSDQFIDWESGKCSFDSPEFIKMLEFSTTFQEEYNWDEYEYESEYTRLASGKQMLQEQYMGDFDTYMRTQSFFGGKAEFVGYPSVDGGGAKLQYSGGLAMSASSKHKDAVWEFISGQLSADYQDKGDGYYWSFPTNKSVMEKMAARAMEQDYYIDEDGNKVYYENGTYYIDGIEIEDRPLTQEEVNEVLAIIDTIDSSIYYDNDLYSIIHEELEFFYNGQKSAADTAAMIQSRAFVYVNEQR
ncbi:MAG: hypothetical protein IJO80_03565 [Firmicutes bacterium]|nr:hypothetical protein [Bacillota bacterium]